MWKIHKILVPTDFSFESMEALSYAIEFVSSFLGVEILLVHVIEPPAHSVPPDGMIPELIGESVRDVSAKRLDEMLAEIPDPIQARSILLEGRPWSEIASLVEQEGVDLVLVATHGYSGFKRFMLGSTAERIVRTAPCPVLTVKGVQRRFVKS